MILGGEYWRITLHLTFLNVKMIFQCEKDQDKQIYFKRSLNSKTNFSYISVMRILDL
jgi:hypothetical protein